MHVKVTKSHQLNSNVAVCRVTAIAGGKHHSMAVTVGGRLMGFGRNTSGELGTGDTINRWGPTDIKFSRSKEPECVYRTAQVTCGANHSLALVTYRGKLTTYATGTTVLWPVHIMLLPLLLRT